MYLASWLNPDIFVAEIGGAQVNMIGGMKLLFTAGIVLYGSACLIKLKDMLGVKINVAAVNTAQTATETVTDDTDEPPMADVETAQAYDDEATVSTNEATIQDGVKAEVADNA
jgi:hypothetical protein